MEIRLQKTLEIIENYKEYFFEYDFFLVSRILSQTASTAKVNNSEVLLCIDIVNAIMNINHSVIQLSQQWYESAQDLISSFWLITDNLTGINDIKRSNMLLSTHIVDAGFRGIEIKNCQEECDINIIRKETVATLQEEIFIYSGKFEVSEKLVNDILKATIEKKQALMVFVIFFNNVLFHLDPLMELSQVFGIHIPNHQTSFSTRLGLSVNLTDTFKQHLTMHCATLDLDSAKWSLNGRYKQKVSNCYFFQQGYYAIAIRQNYTPDISHELRLLSKNKIISFSEKLHTLEALTHYHELFEAKHLLSVSNILKDDTRIDEKDLDSLSTILNNILKFETEILYSAQAESNFINDILNISNKRAASIPGEYSFTDGHKLNLLVCEMNTSNSVTIDKYSAFCNDKKLRDVEDDNLILVTFHPPIWKFVDRSPEEQKFVVTVFRDNRFFTKNKLHTSTVIGFFITPLEVNTQNDLYISYHKSLNHTVKNCGYWDFVSNDQSYGSWWTRPTNLTEMWVICKYRLLKDQKYYALVTREKEAVDLTQILTNIRDKTDDVEKLEKTRNALERFIHLFEGCHINLVSQILNNMITIDSESLEHFFYIINHIMNISRHILVKSQQNYNATDLILHSLEKITRIYHDGKYSLCGL